MKKLKEHWFGLLNGFIFLLALAFYFIEVSGLKAEKEKIEQSLISTTRNLRQLTTQRPTMMWLQQTEANKKSLETELFNVRVDIEKADMLIEGFISTEDANAIVFKLPAVQDRRIYKDILARKWQELADKYCQKDVANKGAAENGEVVDGALKARASLDGKPFLCGVEVPGKLEPTWLRNAENPSSDQDVSESQKRFWIAREIFKICEEAGVLELQSLQLNEVVQSGAYQFKDQAVFQHRDVTLVVVLQVDKTMPMMKQVHDSPLLFRITGFQQDNQIAAPAGVRSNVEFLHFTKGESAKVQLTLNIRHFDYLQPNELTAAASGAEGVAPGALKSGAARSSRGRSRR